MRESAYVLAAVADALAEMGYSVGPDFVTVVPKDGALVDLPYSARYGLMVRDRGHQLLMNVVRYDESGDRDPDQDTSSEQLFCEDFSMVQDVLTKRGVRLDMLRVERPGSHPVQVLRQSPHRQAEKRARTRAATTPPTS